MRVRLGQSYVFDPVGIDIYDARTNLIKGDVVKVVALRGCPPPNTMGHCHAEKDGKLAGLVACNSLKPNPANAF